MDQTVYPNAQRALLLIDLQNDYFPGGKFALWNADQTLAHCQAAAQRAVQLGLRVVHIQHIAEGALAPFFAAKSEGVNIHPAAMAAAPDAPVVVKHFADSFHQTNLTTLLQSWGVRELLVAGMMTQNCVTHTAISKAAQGYQTTILSDCCTTVSEMLHHIALHAVSTRVALTPWESAIAA